MLIVLILSLINDSKPSKYGIKVDSNIKKGILDIPTRMIYAGCSFSRGFLWIATKARDSDMISVILPSNYDLLKYTFGKKP